MKIVCLLENTRICDRVTPAHGLSLFIDGAEHKLLFDCGPDQSFLDNAKILNVDLSQAEFLYLSHGHNDHTGGLRTFMQKYPDKPIYVSEKARGEIFAKRPTGKIEYIGIDEEFKNSPQFRVLPAYYRIEPNILSFGQVQGDLLLSLSNRVLLQKSGDNYIQDSFDHEQNLLIEEQGVNYLFAGCAHCGIANIVENAKKLLGKYPDVVIGGFHLSIPHTGATEAPELIAKLGEYLKSTNARYYTCHCTGAEPMKQLAQVVGERLQTIGTGSRLEF